MHLFKSKVFSQKIYWINKLSGELPETNLILDFIRPSLPSIKNKSFHFDLSYDLSQAIMKLAKCSGFSQYLILISALNILLRKYTRNNDVIVGIPIYDKNGTGNFGNPVIPLRVQVKPEISFKDFLFQVKDSVIGAYTHQNYNFDELIDILKIPTSTNRCSLFDTVVLLENIHNKNSLNHVNNDITFSFEIDEKNIRANIEYSEILFQDETIQLISRHYTNVLRIIINNIDTKISDIVFLKDSERYHLLKQFNNNAKEYPVDKTINYLFEQQVYTTTQNIAVVDGQAKLTYQELNEKANQLAVMLRQLGLGKGEFVGIFKDRDINFLIAILAIYKAGGAYVAIDSTYPANRIEYMLSNSEVKFLLTDASLLDILAEFKQTCPQLKSIICLNEVITGNRQLTHNQELKIYDKFSFINLPKDNLEPISDASDPAYMLYTSGSTGLPKGAIVRHDGAINHIYAQFDELELTEEFCFLQSAPSSTDISVWQFLAPLLIGGRTVIVDIETVAIPDKLFKVLKSEKITVVELVPALFGGLLEHTSGLPNYEKELPNLKWMMVVGESVSVSWVNKWLQIYPEIKIVNAYGPTEAADDITQFIVDKPLPENQRTVPIGKPLANLNLYILDEEMKLLPIGAPGEICVSGIGVGAGYWKNEEKTKLSFVENPFIDARKKLPENRADLIYKTGDLGRWLPDGNIEFLGRIDHQVKIRGFRVELGEIETFLLQHEAVREVVVVVREDDPGDKRLVAYFVPKSEFYQDTLANSELVQQLRDFLQEKLPGHMVPSAIVQLEVLPLAPSGKIDRAVLPVPSYNQESKLGFVAPRTPTEQIVADIWGQVLKQEHVGIHDNFFDLGGHSLLATQVISRLREAFKIELPLRSLFESPTVAQLVEGFIIQTDITLAACKQYIRPGKRQKYLPLSFAQQRLWFLEELTGVSQIFDVPACLYLKGSLNITALESSLNEIVRRHEVLRTTFISDEGRPIQVIHPTFNLPLPVVDFQELPEAEQKIEIQKLIDSEVSRCFNLTEGPLLRCILLRLSQEEHILLFTIHHIVTDGWSLGVIIRELTTLYKAFSLDQPSPLPKLPIQYADFVVWQRQYLQGEILGNLLAYWKQKLSGNLPVLQLPTDYPRPAIQTFSGKRKSFFLSAGVTQALTTLSRNENVTLFMTLLAGFKILLHRYSGQDDILLGSPIANRNQDEVEQLIGFFVNTLVLRTNFSGNPSFQEVLKRLRETTLGAYAHQNMPFDLLVQELQLQRDLSYTPLFQVMFVLHNAPISALEMPDLALTPLEIENHRNVMFDLTLHMTEIEGGIAGSLDYNTDLFDENTICRIADHLQTLFAAIVANPQQRLSDLPMLTKPEQHQLLREWNDTATDYPQDKCIYELFQVQVEKTPDAVALIFENQQLTYRELNQRSNQLAHYLQKLGVKPEVLVGICVERSLSMVIGLLAILKAGGAYVPLDPNYPQKRIAFILEETQAPVLLTQASLVEVIPEHQTQVICLDTDWYLIAQQSQDNVFSELTTDNLAYVIYTSGSTGKPKGVMIKHASTVAMLDWANKTFTQEARTGVLASTSICFDLSVFEVFVPLCCGGKVILIENALYLENLPAAFDVTLINTVPSVISQLIRNNSIPPTVQTVNIAGEPLQNQLVQQLYQQDNIQQVFNLYGPSEDTTYSTSSWIQKGASNTPPIGRPIHNTQAYLLDQNLQPVPVGVAGMLYIGGTGLARGYFNQAELTADKFIPNPYATLPGERLYKTGDLARYLANGEIEYIGRIDNQVKLRGFRIELGEIETIINQCPTVRESVVVVSGESVDSQRIVAYIVPQIEQTLTVSELRGFLEAKLPSYMIPAAFVTLEALPLTPNGKVDRKALPAPELTQVSSSTIIPPSTPIENLLAGIWVEILGIEQVGINNNFFELGGHSLIATRVISQIRQVFQVELPLRYLFEKPTIAGLAKEIEKAIKVDSAVKVTNIEQIDRTQELPLSFAQQRLWFLAQLEPDSPFYNIPAAVRLQGQLNVEALQQSFNEIINRHEALRTNFQTREGQAVAVISQEKPITLSILDISDLEANQQQAEIKQQSTQAAQQPFDISNDHLLRVKLLRLGEQEYIVLLTMHHIVSDGWSIGVLVEELATLYQAFCKGQSSPLPTLPIQYVDFAAWQRQWLQGEALETQISYWLKQLENAPKVLELPTDYPRPVIQTYRGATYSFELSKELSASLNKLSQQQGSTLFMTLLAGFQILLWRYTGQQDIVVGSPIANRNRAEIEGLIGFFVNTLVLRTSLVENPSFEELLKRVREVGLGAYAHQDLPFELLVEQLQPQRDLSHTPLFQVMFVLQNAPMSGLELPDLTLTQLESDSGSAQFDLTLSITETESGLVGSFEYNTDLFAQSSIQRMVGHLQMLFEAIVANPQQRLSDLSLLTEFEQHQLLREWNDTEIEYSQQKCIHELFEAQVDKTPDAVAVIFENQQLTYRELNQRANQLAHYLRSLGVKPEVLVGICVERSLSMVIGLLAILKAGGAYIPLDPNYPQERIAFILEDTQAPVLLTQSSLMKDTPQHQAAVICLDTDWEAIAQHSQDNVFSEITTDNLAYTIYTSGSTGKPKGVQIPHIALSNFLHSMKEVPGLTSEDTLLAVTTYSFDIAALEIFLPIIVGARLVIASREVVTDGNQLSALLVDSKATVMQATPATWQLLLAAGWDGNRQLKILCGGEALPGKLANQLLGLCDCLWNMYGPTETTIWSAASQVETVNNTVPISSPIANTQLYILDKYHQLVPVGVIGELCIGGEGLARGYFQRPDLTAEKFIPNPFSDKPARLYRTGDLARYLANGDIEYIGRIDNQVKLRGFRIELGEIETLISQHPDVRETIVVVHASEADSQRIVAYVVPKTEQAPTISELRGFLEAKLPSYMIPAAFVTLEALPLTPNGKVDRKALPIPDSIRPQLEVVYQLPQTEMEKTIADIWQNLLKLEDVGIHDNFFELGGHSLLLVQVHSNLRQIFKRDISVLDLFRYPTINSLTNYFNQTENQQISDDIMFDINERIADGKAKQRKRLKKIKSGEII